MKNTCVILSIFFTAFLWGSTADTSVKMVDSIFQNSNKLYLANDFENAIDGYMSILDQDVSNQILYYNIGNSYYRSDKLGYARLYYEKAKISFPSNNDVLDDINYNIQFLETKLVDEIKPLPQFFLVNILNKVQSMFSNNGWSLLLIIVLYVNLFFFLVFLFALSSKLKSISVKCILFFFPVLLLVFSIFYMNSYQKEDVFAILVSQNTYVKAAPSFSSSNQFIIHEGIKFQIVDVLDGWSRVLLLDGKDGWIQNTHFVKIN